jgi:hypothetical protein
MRTLSPREDEQRVSVSHDLLISGCFSAAVEGNERLTATTGVVLLALLAAEGATILFLRPLLQVHVFVGMLLIPPVALKLATVGWRFVRYYAGDPRYRLEGPPRLLMRVVVAPALVVSTAVLLGTGVALLVAGPAGGVLLGLHKASFVLWLGAMSVHVLAYVTRLPRLAWADLRRRRLRQARLRLGAVGAALIGGAALAAGTLHLAQPWVEWARLRH